MTVKNKQHRINAVPLNITFLWNNFNKICYIIASVNTGVLKQCHWYAKEAMRAPCYNIFLLSIVISIF